MAESTTEEASGGGSKKTLMIFGGMLLLAVGASIGGTVYFLGGEEAAPGEDVVEERPDKAIYHTLRPAVIVNYVTGGKPRYLQTELTVMVRDPAVVEALITHMPLVRSQILNYFADQEFFALQTHEGKEALREGLRLLIDDALNREEQLTGVQGVLLTSFVMQ